MGQRQHIQEAVSYTHLDVYKRQEEVGEVLDIDRSTVRRDWLKARGWLHERLGPDASR